MELFTKTDAGLGSVYASISYIKAQVIQNIYLFYDKMLKKNIATES